MRWVSMPRTAALGPCCRSRGRQIWLQCRDTGRSVAVGQWARSVESTTGAVAVGVASLCPRLSVRGAPLAAPWLRFQSPLIEPDVQISRIRLSDKTHAFAHGRSRASRPSNSRRGERRLYSCTVVLHTTANAATWADIRSPDRTPGRSFASACGAFRSFRRLPEFRRVTPISCASPLSAPALN